MIIRQFDNEEVEQLQMCKFENVKMKKKQLDNLIIRQFDNEEVEQFSRPQPPLSFLKVARISLARVTDTETKYHPPAEPLCHTLALNLYWIPLLTFGFITGFGIFIKQKLAL